MPSRIHIEEAPLVGLSGQHGGRLVFGAEAHHVRGLSSIHEPREGTLVPVTRAEYVPRVDDVLSSGASVIVSEALAARLEGRPVWVHPEPMAVVARLLASATSEDVSGPRGEGCVVDPTAIVHPRVRLGKRVRVGAYAVIGAPGFGFVAGERGLEHVPQLGGVVEEDDVWIAYHVTIDNAAKPRMANWKPKNIMRREASPRDQRRELDFVASHLTANKLGMVAMPNISMFNAPLSADLEAIAVTSVVSTKPQGRSPQRRPSRYGLRNEAGLYPRTALPQR